MNANQDLLPAQKIPIVIEGYLTEAKLASALQSIFSTEWLGTQLSFGGRRQPWDIAYERDGGVTFVEYDGDEHYRHSIKIKADRVKDEIALASGFRVVRFPYWLQLDGRTCQHFFGVAADVQQSFPHGFITTKIFPASFCEMGVARFRRELNTLPPSVRGEVVQSLRDRAAENGIEFVVSSGLVDIIR